MQIKSYFYRFSISIHLSFLVFRLSINFGNHIIGGLLGTAAGALGAYLVGGGVGLTVGSGDALPYRNRLNQGKYLIVVKGTEELTRQATRILRQFEPENLQGYIEPTDA